MSLNSAEEQNVLANLEKYKNGSSSESIAADDIGGAALANLQQNVMGIMKGGMGKEDAKAALDTVLNTVRGAMPAGVRLPF